MMRPTHILVLPLHTLGITGPKWCIAGPKVMCNWGSPQCLSTPADTSWMGKWGSKEEKKGSRQYFYTACNKDPHINLLSFGTFFILVKSCEAHHCIHSPFQQAWQALQGRNFINYLCRWTPPKLLHPHDLYMTKPPFCN
jgi:hypothetical protein